MRSKLTLLSLLALVFIALIGVTSAGDFLPSTCSFRGSGSIKTIDGRQSFSGNAYGMFGFATIGPEGGTWTHVVAKTGDVFRGVVTDVSCYEVLCPLCTVPHYDEHTIVFTGEGTLNKEDGYYFGVYAGQETLEDDSDFYWIIIYDSASNTVMETQGAITGKFQIGP